MASGCENPYLRQLLTLQQDGSGAISSPSNWLTSPPILRVETPTAEVVKDFATHILGDQTRSPCWCFLVGGPGNGKSMAIRELVVSLLAKGAQITDASGVQLSELGVGIVPSILQVWLEGRLVAVIAQDASVVSNPYSSKPDPSRELRELIGSCESARCSLIACTNRGVLERAAAEATSLDPILCRDSLQTLVELGKDSTGVVEHVLRDMTADLSIVLVGTALDATSLFEGAPAPMEQLFTEATASINWQVCGACEHATVCPFLQNRNALSDMSIRGNVLRVLEDSELIDGQPLVFREAVAIVSLLLAGCPADYPDGSPCNWVSDLVANQRWFALAGRRIHMALFSAPSPIGLDPEASPRQQRFLEMVLERAGLDHKSLLSPLATKVGIPRLFSASGVLRKLDVMNSPPHVVLHSEGWDFDFGPDLASYPSQLERNCLSMWQTAESAFEEEWPEAAECMAALSRWRSAHTLRSGVIETGLYPWRQELDTYRTALSIPSAPSLSQKNILRELIKRVLDGGEKTIRISANLSISNSSVGAVDIDWDASKRRRGLWLSMQGSSMTTRLSALAFVWLARRQQAPLHESTFPVAWLETSRDAIARAAAGSCYSRLPTGQLEIRRVDGSSLTLLWDGTSVEVQAAGSDHG